MLDTSGDYLDKTILLSCPESASLRDTDSLVSKVLGLQDSEMVKVEGGKEFMVELGERMSCDRESGSDGCKAYLGEALG